MTSNRRYCLGQSVQLQGMTNSAFNGTRGIAVDFGYTIQMPADRFDSAAVLAHLERSVFGLPKPITRYKQEA